MQCIKLFFIQDLLDLFHLFLCSNQSLTSPPLLHCLTWARPHSGAEAPLECDLPFGRCVAVLTCLVEGSTRHNLTWQRDGRGLAGHMGRARGAAKLLPGDQWGPVLMTRGSTSVWPPTRRERAEPSSGFWFQVNCSDAISH